MGRRDAVSPEYVMTAPEHFIKGGKIVAGLYRKPTRRQNGLRGEACKRVSPQAHDHAELFGVGVGGQKLVVVVESEECENLIY